MPRVPRVCHSQDRSAVSPVSVSVYVFVSCLCLSMSYVYVSAPQASPSPTLNRRDARAAQCPTPAPPAPTARYTPNTPYRQAWYGGFIAGLLRYLFAIATGARELPPSPIGPAGRWLAKVAALASVAALALSIGGVHGTADDVTGAAAIVATGRGVWAGATAGAPSALPCAVGVAVLCASFSIDFYQIWVVLPREAVATAAAAAAEAGAATTATAAAAASAVTVTDTSVVAVTN